MQNGITAIELNILECTWGPGNSERSRKPEIRLSIKPGTSRTEVLAVTTTLAGAVRIVSDVILTTKSAKYKRVGKPHKRRTSACGHTRYVRIVLRIH